MLNGKRLAVVFGTMLLVFSIILCNLFMLSSNSDYARRVQAQTQYVLPLESGRANIYDCNLKPLTGAVNDYYVLALPGEQDYSLLFDLAAEEERGRLLKQSGQPQPFLVKLKGKADTENLRCVYGIPRRYFTSPIAAHTVGYLNSDGDGVTGIERQFNDYLKNGADQTFVNCRTNALVALINGFEPYVTAKQGTGYGVMLTIDSTIQRICEGIAAENMRSGAIVVMETATGKIKASVSVPVFDPYNIEKSITAGDSSLVNRAESAFNVGSVFKPLLAAAALSAGIDPNEEYECRGYTEVDGHIYRCANLAGHGKVNMEKALEESCNCYFINLGRALGADAVYDTAVMAGFGMPCALGGGYTSGGGVFPSRKTLENSGELACVSFGQGQLLASPVQIAAYFNIFANDGVYISPSLVQGLVSEYTGKVVQSFYSPSQTRILQSADNEILKEMLVNVIRKGRAQQAQPMHWNAGGKTGTAQTGRFYTDDETGEQKEIYEIWFAGFYPADEPKYTIVVMKDESVSYTENCCKIFADICDSLYYYL